MQNNIFSMENKVALITGATGYLGLEMAKALGDAGAHILVNSRCNDRATLVVDQLKSCGYSASSAVFDVTSQSQVDNFFAEFQGKLNVLVNNAYSGRAGIIKTATIDDYKHSFESSVISAHNTLSSSLNALRLAVIEDGDASVINICSMYGSVSPYLHIYNSVKSTNPPFYGVSKAGLIQLTRYAAVEFGEEKIRINAISPGPFPSKSSQASDPLLIDRLEKKVPMGRIGRAEEIRGPILFLASSASSYVNGANIPVDGGWTIW